MTQVCLALGTETKHATAAATAVAAAGCFVQNAYSFTRQVCLHTTANILADVVTDMVCSTHDLLQLLTARGLCLKLQLACRQALAEAYPTRPWSFNMPQASPCPALPCPALPCPALPCPALPCPALPPLPTAGKQV